MSINLEMSENRVLLKRVSIQKKTAAGLILGDITSREEDASAYAEVIAIGEGKIYDGIGLVPTKYKNGDIICYNPRVIIKVNYKGEYYGIMRENDVFFRIPTEELSTIEVTDFDESEGKEYDYKRASIIN